MKNFSISIARQTLGIMLFALLAMTATAQAQDDGISKAVDIQADTDGVSVVFMTDTTRDLLSFSVRIVGPKNYMYEDRQELDSTLQWEPPMDLADGGYAWEARVVTADAGAGMRSSLEGLHPDARIEQLFAPEVQQTHVASGTFRVDGGLVQKPYPQGEDDDVSAARRVAHAIVDFFFPSAHAQLDLRSDGNVGVNVSRSNSRFLVRSDDEEYAFRVQVGGATSRLVVADNGGTAIGEFWGSTSIPARGLRVFGDTELDSNLAVGGDLSIGGSFAAGAADFSSDTFISGNLGVGTNSAARRITSNSAGCQYRLENSSDNSVYQLCTGVGANDGFEILGSRTGSTSPRPFRINGDAPTNSLVVSAAGLGVGTFAPAAPIHVTRDSDSEMLFLEHTNSADIQDRNMILLSSNGGGRIYFRNRTAPESGNDSRSWVFATTEPGFRVSRTFSGTTELELDNAGNLSISGTLSQGSSRTMKNNIEPLSGAMVLANLSKLEFNEWSYDQAPGQRHAGPMAEDFFDIFGLGPDNKHIAPGDMAGLSLAAVKALHEKNQQLVKALHEENQQLKERLARIEQAMLQDSSL